MWRQHHKKNLSKNKKTQINCMANEMNVSLTERIKIPLEKKFI